jgi:DNA-binding winged helix-turn-helix (wHTH) protein
MCRLLCSSSVSVGGKLKCDLSEFSSRESKLRRQGIELSVGRKSLDILVFLAESPGEIVPEK